MTKTDLYGSCTRVWHLRSAHQTHSRVDPLRPNLIFVITIPKKNVPHDLQNGIERRPAILYNLRENLCAKIEYLKSYSNSTTQITPCSDPPCSYRYYPI
jgi:hypothetical protein